MYKFNIVEFNQKLRDLIVKSSDFVLKSYINLDVFRCVSVNQDVILIELNEHFTIALDLEALPDGEQKKPELYFNSDLSKDVSLSEMQTLVIIMKRLNAIINETLGTLFDNQ